MVMLSSLLLTVSTMVRADALDQFNRGYQAFVDNNLPAAIQHYNQAIALSGAENERKSFIYYHLGVAYSRLGSYQSALDSFDRATTINPDIRMLYRERGNVLSLTGQYQLAIKDYDRSLFYFKDDADVLHNRGFAWYQLGSPQQAINDYSRVLELEPGSIESLLNRSIAWLEMGENSFALIDCRAVIEQQPASVEALNTCGKAHFNLEQLQLAKADFDRAVQQQAGWESLYNRGFVKLQLQDNDAALQDFELALQKSPGNAQIVAARDSALLAKQGGEIPPQMNPDNSLLALSTQKPTLQSPTIERTGSTVPESNAATQPLESVTQALKPVKASSQQVSSVAMLPPESEAFSDNTNIASSATAAVATTDASSDFSTELSNLADTSDLDSLKQLGWQAFKAQRYSQALQYFNQYLKVKPSDLYRILAIYISSGHAGGDVDQSIKPFIYGTMTNDWPGSLINFYRGLRSEADIVQQMNVGSSQKRRQRTCEGSYYLGEYYLLKGDKQRARQWMEKSVATQMTHFNEYVVAQRYLDELAQP